MRGVRRERRTEVLTGQEGRLRAGADFGSVQGFQIQVFCCCLGAEAATGDVGSLSNWVELEPGTAPSNAPVGHSYSGGGDTAGRPGRSSAEYSTVIGSRCRKSKLVAARLRLPSDASRAGIVLTTGRS